MNRPKDPPVTPEAVVPALTQAMGRILRRLRVEANPGGLSISQSAVLASLAETDGLSNAELARVQAMKPQSMSTLLSGLEGEGLVKRHSHPSDGRQFIFTLTPLGLRTRHMATEAKHAWLLAAMGRLSAEQRKTLLAAAALIDDLAAVKGEPS